MNRNLYSIGILTALWGRHELADIVLEYYRHLDMDGIEFDLCAVGSEGAASRFLAESNGWHYVEAPNEPLSDKWNAGMAYFENRVDAVLIIGSDDFITPHTINVLIGAWEAGSDAVNINDLYFYDQAADTFHFAPRTNPGAGMLIDSTVLRRLGWAPWPSGIERRLDGHLMNRLHKQGYPCKYRNIKGARAKDLVLIDVKTPENMWSVDDMQAMTGRIEQLDPSEMDTLIPGLRDLLKTQQLTEENG